MRIVRGCSGVDLVGCVAGTCTSGEWVAAGIGVLPIGPGGGAVGLLGHYPAYTQFAERLGAEVFDVGAKWAAMNTAERWAANRAFLDTGIGKGMPFVLATDVRAGMSYFRAETQYLLRNGYQYGTFNGMKALVKKP